MQTLASMNYEIQNGMIILTLEGLCPVEDLLQITRSALDDTQAKIPARILVDASRSKAVRNSAEIELIATTVSAWRNEIAKAAFYVTSELHFGVIRMGTAFSRFSSFDVAPFRTFKEAADFLNEP